MIAMYKLGITMAINILIYVCKTFPFNGFVCVCVLEREHVPSLYSLTLHRLNPDDPGRTNMGNKLFISYVYYIVEHMRRTC